MHSFNKICFLIIILLHLTHGADILVVFPHIYYSHFKATSSLASQLALRGHRVTFVNPMPGEIEKHENITEISIEGIKNPIKEFENDFLQNDNNYESYWSKLKYSKNLGLHYTKEILQNENITQLIHSNATFQLTIIEDVGADGLAVLAHIFHSPLAVLVSEPISLFYDNYFSDNTFWKQLNELRNAHHWVIKELYREWYVLPSQNELIRQVLPSHEFKDLRDILYKTDLVLSPGYNTLGNLIPKYKNVKEVGGFHIGTPTMLPYQIERMLNNSKDGFILVSSNIPKELTMRLRTELYAQKEIVQNVFFTSDISDVIGHPQLKLFIGDGDVYDTALAIAHQVPLITVSNNRWDQKFLIDVLSEKRIAPKLAIDNIVSPEVLSYISDVILNNHWYKENMKTPSEIIKSASSTNQAIFWLEYLIRFNGDYMKPDQLQWRLHNRLVLIIIVLSIVDIALFLLFYWIIKHLPRVMQYCGKKIHRGVRKWCKKNKPTVSYIKL